MSSNPYRTVDYSQPLTGQTKTPPTIVQAVWPLIEARGWLKFLGWFNIILGAIYCVSIVGAIVGWLPLWLGILAKGAGDKLEAALPGQDLNALYYATKDLKTIITIIGVLTILWLILMACGLMIWLLIFVVALMRLGA